MHPNNFFLERRSSDFCCSTIKIFKELKSSPVEATAVKKCLRDAIHTTGLVVSRQTESTLSLEALASELECEQVQGFYNTAQPSDGNIVMHHYADLEGKSNAVLSGTSDGEAWKTPDIVKHSCFTQQNVSTAIKKLLDTGAISRIKREHYQKK